MSQESTYIPGVCNINKEEIAYRKKAGYFGLGASVVVITILLVLDANQYLRLIAFFPVFVTAIGFLQAKNKFCVAYGAAGKQNATDGGKVSQIKDRLAISGDKVKARRMNLQALAISLVATIVLVLI